MKKKKESPLYDANGRWVEERGRIKGAFRKAFRLSPQMRETLAAARVELPPITKKDGEPGKRPQVRYRCAICDGLFPQKHVQVDHKIPVVPLHKKEEEMTYDEIARGVFCNKCNLQVVCSTPMKLNGGKGSCHKKKTDEENFVRRKLAGSGLATSEDEWKILIDKARQEHVLYLKEKEELKCKKKTRKSKTVKK